MLPAGPTAEGMQEGEVLTIGRVLCGSPLLDWIVSLAIRDLFRSGPDAYTEHSPQASEHH